MVIDGGPQVLKLASSGGLAHHARRPAAVLWLAGFLACDVRVEGLRNCRTLCIDRKDAPELQDILDLQVAGSARAQPKPASRR
jgi:hypothetical protein